MSLHFRNIIVGAWDPLLNPDGTWAVADFTKYLDPYVAAGVAKVKARGYKFWEEISFIGDAGLFGVLGVAVVFSIFAGVVIALMNRWKRIVVLYKKTKGWGNVDEVEDDNGAEFGGGQRMRRFY